MAVVAGERRIVAVLFADIVGSTAIGERLGAERSKFLVDEVMRLMSAEVARFEGTVAQFVGDELYAVFGAPVAHEDDSERAVLAALAIQAAITRYAIEVRDAYGVELAVRISINTGPVMFQPESDDPYNALGDTVNVAARLQELATGGEIVVARGTKTQVEGCFELEPLGVKELRGREASVETFRVIGVDESSVDALLPLVGRDFEMTVLERTMDGLVEGRGAIVSITGEPGIGKTRLLAEIRHRYRDRVRFVEGRSVSYARTSPYGPIRDLLREWLRVGASTPEARARLDLKAELARVLGEPASDAYPFLATLLGLSLDALDEARVREFNRESLQHETFAVFSDLVARLADETPLCLVLDDLHWADDSSLDLVEHLFQITEQAAVGLFLVYRSERDRPSWRLGERARQRFPHRYREIELGPLPPDASRALATSAAGELPASVVDLLIERAGGNPFFLQAALHDLQERGDLRREDGGWRLAVREDQLSIPVLVQGALQARIDRLDPATRNVLGLAAVIGRTFGLQLLGELVPADELAASLSELQRLDLIVEQRRRPQAEYRFRHGLVQEVAYASMAEAKRRKLHRQVGDALAAVTRDAPESAYGLLARHFSEADVPDLAAEYLLRAGDAARSLYANEEALAHYRRARDFLFRIGDDRRARDTLFKIALAHHLAFDFEHAEAAYDEAFCCRVEPSPRLPRTERIETALEHANGPLAPSGSFTTESAMMIEHLFRGLVMVNRELNVVPAMADNFRVSSDGVTYLFRIREGMRWSDGVPVTADDFVFGWERMRGGGEASIVLEDIEEARALDDRTLEVRLSEPRSYFPYVLASAWAVPWPRHRVEQLGDAWSDPENLVGNGPFVLAEYSTEHALLTSNPHWVGPHGNVAEIHVSLGLSAAEHLDAWRAGRFDVVEGFDVGFADCPETYAEAVPGFGTQYVAYRATVPPFSNELVRKAFSHALDRSTPIHANTLSRPAGRGGALPPALPGHGQRVAPEFDLELGRTLLAEAGYPEGRGLPELVFYVPDWLADPSPLIEQWARIGARIRPVHSPPCELWTTPPDAHLWLAGWAADYPDPDGFFRGFLRQTEEFYCDEEIDDLVVEARSLRDPAERMRRYHEVDRLFVGERAAIVPVSYTRSVFVRRPWIENLWANPMAGAHLDQVVVNRAGASPGSKTRGVDSPHPQES